MTGPGGGDNTGGDSGTGPGRLPAVPLSFAQREEHYRAQNERRPLTPRQCKRLLKKSHQAQARAERATGEVR